METSPRALSAQKAPPQGPRLGALVRALLIASIVTATASIACRAIASRLTINVTSSVPRGLYWLRPGSHVDRNSIVRLAIPPSLRALVAERHYLPTGFHLLKRVVAVPGDHVCTDHFQYTVNHHFISAVASVDLSGRPLPLPYPFCSIVPPGLAFLAAAGASSLDSRYFGPVPINDLTPAVTLWTFY